MTACFCIQLFNPTFANDETKMVEKPVVEFVIFKVSDPVEGIKAALALLEDAQAFNNAIISSEIYQSASDPYTIAQLITWKSLKEAKAAFAASENFPNMERIMGLITESKLFDHFYKK